MKREKQDILRNVDEHKASEILGLAVQTLRNFRFKQVGPPYCKMGRSVRYHLPDLYDYIESHKIRPPRQLNMRIK